MFTECSILTRFIFLMRESQIGHSRATVGIMDKGEDCPEAHLLP